MTPTTDDIGPTRVHPDIFTPEQAATYLRLPSKESLRKLREEGLLIGFDGRTTYMLYWREDLDKCALRMVGRDPTRATGGPSKMRMAGGQ